MQGPDEVGQIGQVDTEIRAPEAAPPPRPRRDSAEPSIRPLERNDLPRVDELLAASLPAWRGDPAFLAASLLDHPWFEDDLPSLVAVDDDDTVLGFLGVQVRRLRAGGEVLRGVCGSHLVVAPGSRGRGVGSALIRRLMAGPQAATWTDAASDSVLRMCRSVGGHLDHSRACDWMLVLRPAGWLARVGAARMGNGPNEATAAVSAIPLGILRPGFARRSVAVTAPGVTGEDVGTEKLVEHLPVIGRRFAVRVDYDKPYLDNLFAQIEALHGSFVRRLVRREGVPVGWYVHVPSGKRGARVLHLAAISEEEMSTVLDELLAHARELRLAAVAGRAGPPMWDALRHRSAVLGFARQPVIHARDAQLRANLSTSSSLLTQLDGEWFLT
jgi:GNAT superfamily N-acetyltransferase